MSKDNPLTVEIVDGVLNISLGIDILCLATQSEIYDFKIVDNNGFSNDIINELLSEEKMVQL